MGCIDYGLSTCSSRQLHAVPARPAARPWGWSLSRDWVAAAAGVTAEPQTGHASAVVDRVVRGDGGWVAVVAAAPLIERMSTAGLVWLVAVGSSYMARSGSSCRIRDGATPTWFWHWSRWRSACHFCAALWHVDRQGLMACSGGVMVAS